MRQRYETQRYDMLQAYSEAEEAIQSQMKLIEEFQLSGTLITQVKENYENYSKLKQGVIDMRSKYAKIPNVNMIGLLKYEISVKQLILTAMNDLKQSMEACQPLITEAQERVSQEKIEAQERTSQEKNKCDDVAQDNTSCSFLLHLLAHPKTKTINAVLLISSLLLLGIVAVTVGQIPLAAGALLGGIGFFSGVGLLVSNCCVEELDHTPRQTLS